MPVRRLVADRVHDGTGEFMRRLFDDRKTWICDDWRNGNLKVLDYACGTGIASQALASHASSIIGIDEDDGCVRIYNEIVKRLQHPTCAMRAYTGDLIPHYQTGEVPGLQNPSVFEGLGDFDLVVISLGMDCFEILPLSPVQRRHQLVENLKAIFRLLHENGTLLIVDVQKLSGRLEPTKMGSLIHGYKTTGYHSSDIVDALQSIGVKDVDILDGIRFQWEATTEQKKIWLPAEADEILFMLKAKKRSQNCAEPKDGKGCTHLCIRCCQPATKSCAACVNAPADEYGSHESSWYCGVDCQKGDWHRHKSLCNAPVLRKVLYRAAETAQELFYIYREIVFDKLIVKVARKEKEIIVHEGLYEECFIPFPSSLFPEEKEKKAMLTYLACGDVCGYLGVVLKTMLNDISSRLLETPVKLKATNPLKIRLHYYLDGSEDLNSYQHEVLTVTLKDGSVYVVDLAGAQYGYHEPVMPLKTYADSRARAVRLDKSMLRLHEKDFLKRQKSFLSSVEANFREYKRSAEESGRFKVEQVPLEPVGQSQNSNSNGEYADESSIANFCDNAVRNGKVLDLSEFGMRL
ncbi:MAG: hypothetical protein Q9211_001527 [Gyalolechia sp. 1 TL-2023]